MFSQNTLYLVVSQARPSLMACTPCMMGVALLVLRLEKWRFYIQFQDTIKVIRRYEGWYYIQSYSYYIILYFESDWCRIRSLELGSLVLVILQQHLFLDDDSPEVSTCVKLRGRSFKFLFKLMTIN